MLKYYNTQVAFQEFPGEITLAINLTNCPNHCPGCHSPWLQEDIGRELTLDEIDLILSIQGESPYTCIGFMGGDNDVEFLLEIVKALHESHPKYRIGWYTGQNIPAEELGKNYSTYKHFDYIKTGPYVEVLGGLDKPTTNQRMYRNVGIMRGWLDITKYFQTLDPQFRDMVNNFDGHLAYMVYAGEHWNKDHPDCPFPNIDTTYRILKSGLENYFVENC